MDAGFWMHAEPTVLNAVGPGAISMQGFAGHYHKKKILSLLFTALFLRTVLIGSTRISSFIYLSIACSAGAETIVYDH